jgi:ribosomal protein S18
MTRMNNGKQIVLLQKVISKDGKTMRQTETGTDAKGKLYKNQLLYDKQ